MASEDSVSIRARNNTVAKRTKLDSARYAPFSTHPASQGFSVYDGDLG